MARLFLGLDSSTQSLTATVIDLDANAVVYEASINFDQALPKYGTQHGVLVDEDPQVVHTPPLVWVAALELAMQQMVDAKVDLGAVLAVSGSGQQHGSVYLNASAKATLANLDPNLTLVECLGTVFSRATSPIWMDSSTSEECDEIRSALGGLQATTEATGSNTFERFTGPQIRKFYKQDPDAYAATEHIGLVSSFMASILIGGIAPVEEGDGAGMNLMDITQRAWHPGAVEATAPDLLRRLPSVEPADSLCGNIATYFIEKYGFSPSTRVAPFSGDNPSSVIGTGLVKPGMVAISLGTSDTYFGTMAACQTDPHGEGHVFGSPTGDYMTLICFKNGSLAREQVCDDFKLDWEGFSNGLRKTPPGNEGKLLLPWFEPEIVPRVLAPGVHRKGLESDDAFGHCRGVVEAQMMSMRLHSAWMKIQPAEIYATGGASANRDILQVMANVHNCPVSQFESTNGASLGAALRAAHAWLGEVDSAGAPDWVELVSPFTQPVAGSRIDPDPAAVAIYDSLMDEYAAFERSVLFPPA